MYLWVQVMPVHKIACIVRCRRCMALASSRTPAWLPCSCCSQLINLVYVGAVQVLIHSIITIMAIRHHNKDEEPVTLYADCSTAKFSDNAVKYVKWPGSACVCLWAGDKDVCNATF